MKKFKKPQMGEIYWSQYFDLKKLKFVPSRVVGWADSERENFYLKAGMIRLTVTGAQALSDNLNRAIERECELSK